MAIRNVVVSAVGVASDTPNSQAALLADADAAIDAIGTANAESGSSADVTTEVGLAVAALALATANQPTGGIVVSVDLSVVTTRAALRRLLDAAYAHLISTSLIT